MKFALNIISLALSVMVLWTAPTQSFSNARQKLVFDIMASDRNWMKHLNVGIKLNPKKLSATAKEVLLKLKVIKAMSMPVVNPENAEEKINAREDHEMVVVKALHIILDVASNYNKNSMALDFALDVIASVVKCNTLMYILIQLKSIEGINKLQNSTIKSQPLEVWDTLIQVLDKMAMLKKSIKEEFDLYRHWEKFTTDFIAKNFPPSFYKFKKLVEEMLRQSCELHQIEHIEKHLQLNIDKTQFSVDKAITNFDTLQTSLKEMFNDMRIISTMDTRIWEHLLNKIEFIEPTEPTEPTEQTESPVP